MTNTSDNETIRVSAASLAHISLDGKILVGLNKKRLKAGNRVYTPFGGSLEFYEQARPYLQSIGALFESKNDLRLELPRKTLPSFATWFYERKDREISVFRELQEELVQEESALVQLNAADVTLEHVCTATEEEITDRPGQNGKKTFRYFEIFNAVFTPIYEAELRKSLQNQYTRLRLVTPQEITAEITVDGVKIGSNCKPLLYEIKK